VSSSETVDVGKRRYVVDLHRETSPNLKVHILAVAICELLGADVRGATIGRRSFADNEIELAAGWCVNFENLERLVRHVAERMPHSRGNEDNLVFLDGIYLPFDDKLTISAANDINIVGDAMFMQLAARAAWRKCVHVNVKGLGA
jgi:hypothetical protein